MYYCASSTHRSCVDVSAMLIIVVSIEMIASHKFVTTFRIIRRVMSFIVIFTTRIWIRLGNYSLLLQCNHGHSFVDKEHLIGSTSI